MPTILSRAALKFRIFPIPALILAIAALAIAPPGEARSRNKRSRPFRSALLIEAETGQVLKSIRPRLRVIPASIVKMMTILLTLERVQEKSISMNDIVVTSRKAARIGGQQVYLKQGERFRLKELLKAVAINSANDAAYAIAEHVTGDADIFVEMMNDRARELGMADTRYVNVHGLPPNRGQPPNLMSARDAGILAQALLKFPIVTQWGKTKRAPFRGGKFILTNTNRLVGRFRGIDGIKTGSYRKAGYSIVATAKRGDLRLIAIILSSGHPRRRFQEAKRLLSWGFAKFRWYQSKASVSGRALTVKIQSGQKDRIRLTSMGNFRKLVHRGEVRNISVRREIPSFLAAPVQKGQQVGRLVFELRGKEMGELRLAAGESVDRLGFFQMLIRLR